MNRYRRTNAPGAPGTYVTSGPGYSIPAHSLDRWKAARNAAATALAEVVIFGDSTFYGSVTGSAFSVYSIVSRLRRESIAAGYADGGRGMIYRDSEDGARPTDEQTFDVVLSNTGFTASSDSFSTSPQATTSTTAGNTITFQGYCTAFRLHYTTGSTHGAFTYSIDGGAAVTVIPGGTIGTDSILAASGLTLGLHTITITNLGYYPYQTPVGFGGSLAVNTASGGTLANGTYYYKATGVTGSGETLPLAFNPVTITNSFNKPTFTVAKPSKGGGYTSYNIYRSTSVNGTYGLVQNVAASGSFTNIADDGTSINNAINPPTVSTAGNDTSLNRVAINVDILKSTGIVYHKDAVSGTSFGTYFGTSNPVSVGPLQAQRALGLTPTTTGAFNSFGFYQTKAAGQAYRQPALAICALGVNDLQGCTVADQTTAPTSTEQDSANRRAIAVREGISLFARMCRSAGCDGLVVIPHLSLALYTQFFEGTIRNAIAATAAAEGLPIVDLNVAIGNPTTMVARGLGTPGVHSSEATYNAEAAFLWSVLASV